MNNQQQIRVNILPFDAIIKIEFNGYTEKYYGYTPHEALAKFRDWYCREVSADEGVNNAIVQYIGKAGGMI